MAETAEQVCSGCGEKIYKDPHCKGAWLHGDQRQATGKPCFGNAEPVPTLPPTAAEPSELNQENVSALIAEVTSKDGHFPVLWISILRNWSVEKMDKLRLYLTPVEAEPSEPKADGFDEWFGASGYVESFRPNALEIWNVGEQSGVRKGMQRALELVPKRRPEGTNPFAAEYNDAIRNCEAAIQAELAKEQQ